MKIAIIGERDFIWGFKGMGFFTFPVSDTSQAARALDEIGKGGYSLVYITETFARPLLERIDEVSRMAKVDITIMPGVQEKQLGLEKLRRIAIRAVGADIFTES
ncbi:MAG: V-type ATP synthase subunit F [bacterium]